FQSSKSYNHYSVLTTLETAWGLPPLTSEDSSASAMTEFFKNLAPQTSLSYAPTRPVVGDSIGFSSTATGGIPPYTFSWNFGESTSNVRGGTGLPNTMTHTYTKAGTYIVTANATDTNGKIGSALATVTVAAPLTLTVSGPSSGIIGTSISFSAAASGGTSPYSFSWNFGDASSGSGNSVAHVYTASGSYGVTVTVKDSAGITATSSSRSLAVSARLQVSSVRAVPNPTETGYSISLSATTSGGVSPVSCNWNLGDGSPPSSGCSITHVYANAANYTVTVNATDNLGVTATNSTTMIVS